jgi:hypothetical protein
MKAAKKPRWLPFLLSVLGVCAAFLALKPEQRGILAIPVLLWAPLFLLGNHVLYPALVGFQCPSCGNRTLKRLARVPGYFECVGCRARLTWNPLTSAWKDASGPEADRFFRRRSRAGRWLGYRPPAPGKSTVGSLLRSKWIRNRSGPIKPVAMSPPDSESDSLHDPWLDG